jgi:hypothetical protein
VTLRIAGDFASEVNSGSQHPEGDQITLEFRERRSGSELKIKTDNVGRLGLAIRVIAGHVVAPPERLQTSLGPDTGYSDVTEAQCGGEFARTA